MLNKLKIFAVCVVLFGFAAVFILRPSRYIPVCFDGICLWAECVLPALLPFMIINLLLTNLKITEKAVRPTAALCRKAHMPAYALPLFIMAAASGYPAGSRLILEYKSAGMISESEAEALAPLCSAPSPLFAIGSVGVKAFGNAISGIKIAVCSYISVLGVSVIYILIRKPKANACAATAAPNEKNALEDSFCGAANACITAGAFIAFFYTLAEVIADYNIFMPVGKVLGGIFGEDAAVLTRGLIEATGACFKLAANGGKFAMPLCGFLCTFGGASILLQQLCHLMRCGVKPLRFAGLKFLQGAVTFLMLLAI